MRVCRKLGPDSLVYVPPPAEITVQGQGYGGIWSNTHSSDSSPAEVVFSATEEETTVVEDVVQAT